MTTEKGQDLVLTRTLARPGPEALDDVCCGTPFPAWVCVEDGVGDRRPWVTLGLVCVRLPYQAGKLRV